MKEASKNRDKDDAETAQRLQGIDQQKEQAQFWLQYSHRLSATIRYGEALAAVEHALALDSVSREAWYVKGTCLGMLADYASALEAFEQCLQLDAHYVPAWDGKAWVLGILGRREEALIAINRALELDPEYFEAQRRKRRLEAM